MHGLDLIIHGCDQCDHFAVIWNRRDRDVIIGGRERIIHDRDRSDCPSIIRALHGRYLIKNGGDGEGHWRTRAPNSRAKRYFPASFCVAICAA